MMAEGRDRADDVAALRERLRETERRLREIEKRHEIAMGALAEKSAVLAATEAGLRRSEERYELATSAAAEGIYEWDVAAGSMFLTEQAKAFFAFAGDALTPNDWNVRVHPDDFAGYRRAIVEHFKGRARLLEHEYRIANADGSYRWVLDRGIGVRDAGGRVVKVVGALSDITQRKRAELELRHARDEAEEALAQQIATAEILRVISRSPTDVQPVFDAIVTSARRLCDAAFSGVFLRDEGLMRMVASEGLSPENAAIMQRQYPRPAGPDTVTGRAVLGRRVVHVDDMAADDAYATAPGRLVGVRSILGVPMLRDDQAIGAIGVWRNEVAPFSEKQIALLKTFADQAVIAIENVRLFTELAARTAALSRSVEELRALGEVGRAVSSTLDLETVLATIVARATELAGVDGGALYEYDEAREEFHLHTTDRLPAELADALRAAPVPKGEGAIGQLAVTGEPVEIRDIAGDRGYRSRVRETLIRLGLRSILAVPLLREDRLLGGLVVNRSSAGAFAPEVIALLRTFAAQSALAIQNARLFRELDDKSRQLEAASRHKSEFLANMSHELRTPLNAIIGFSEILSERLFGDVNAKQAEYLADILESGRHLLSLINDILDLSKIEAGRMELDISEFNLPSAIENTLILVRERAQRRGIALGREIDGRLATMRGDERKVKQVLLNLLSNALKFTPEGGRIDVVAGLVDGSAEVSVKDTGVGIAAEDQRAVFEEFRQVGTASKKVEGTGLGLAISRKFIELHGGDIRVESELGRGSTFTFTLPLARKDPAP
jgi:PAS domain S-box-containing protein